MVSAASATGALRVLIIEDDAGVARVVRDGLNSYGCASQHVTTLEAGRKLLAADKFDALVLDLTLPDGSGLELAGALRKGGNELPILMLTARDTVYERVDGFRHGADDYLCKPFDVEELVARLQAICRRSKPSDRFVLRYADVELDLITRTVKRKRITATLSAREAELLAFLMRHPEEALPRERILEQVWGDEAEDDSNVLNVYVNYLRNKIEASLYPRIIHTVRGVGYVLADKAPDEAT
jgi:two-component system, OmpR family, response regulator MprA